MRCLLALGMLAGCAGPDPITFFGGGGGGYKIGSSRPHLEGITVGGAVATYSFRFEGRPWQEGGEWLDCEIDHPDGTTRTMAFSTNGFGQVDDPAKPGYFSPCMRDGDDDW